MNSITTMYYDGECHLCSREVDHYRKVDRTKQLAFVDISSPDFDAVAVGLDPQAVVGSLHVRTAEGQVVDGVDAFIAIWKSLPQYNWLARIVEKQPVHRLAEFGYAIFARVRPFLPKRIKPASEGGANCDSGTCKL